MGEPLGEGELDFDGLPRLADENANELSADARWSLAGGEVGRDMGAGRGSGGRTGWVACWE